MADDFDEDDAEATEEVFRMAAHWQGDALLRPALGHLTANGCEWFDQSRQDEIMRQYNGARMAERKQLASWLLLNGYRQIADAVLRGEHLEK